MKKTSPGLSGFVFKTSWAIALLVATQAANAALLHRYSFDGAPGTTVITDSVGAANGTLVNGTGTAGLNGSGQLVLDGNQSSAWMSLPSGIMPQLTNATFEIWVNDQNLQTWAELWTFGTNDGSGGQGPLLSMIPVDGGVGGQIGLDNWAREVRPSEPVTSGVWLGDYLANPSPIQRLQLEQSDIVTFHNYDGPAELRKRIEGLKKLGRPVLCTEYMARGNHSTFQDNLPVFKVCSVAAWSWGLVNGKSNTIYPWDSWVKHYTNEPSIWFHDLFRVDGTPFSAAEVQLIRNLSSCGNATQSLAEPPKNSPRHSAAGSAKLR